MLSAPIRIIIGDDHPIVLEALSDRLVGSEQFLVVATARSFPEVAVAARRHRADVLILDLGGMNGSPLAIIQRLNADCPALKIIVFSSTIDLAPELMKAGAAGYVAKEERTSVLLEAITAVVAGEEFRSPFVQEYVTRSARDSSLTPKELVAVKLLSQGLTTVEIAAYMRIDARSVQNYITSILRKKALQNRIQLIEWYRNTYCAP